MKKLLPFLAISMVAGAALAQTNQLSPKEYVDAVHKIIIATGVGRKLPGSPEEMKDGLAQLQALLPLAQNEAARNETNAAIAGIYGWQQCRGSEGARVDH